jgi:hypothetical protein
MGFLSVPELANYSAAMGADAYISYQNASILFSKNLTENEVSLLNPNNLFDL